MDPFSFPPIAAVLDAAYSGLMMLAAILEPVVGGAAAPAAIVLITLLARAALIPAGVLQAKSEQTQARLAPALAKLRLRYGKDRERLQRETMHLYATEKVSPAAGCLPVLLQAPVVGVIYALFLHTSIAGHANALMTEQLFGVSLGASFVSSWGSGTLTLSTIAVFGAFVLVIALVAELSRRAFSMPNAPRFVGVLQFVTAGFALFVPLAAVLYLTVTVAWTLGQRIILRRKHPLPPPR
ncbi:YidC/Oxa1 family membrane protein insertase [Microbacterium endophyticum]|uniref:Membrane protein insertase YidC n=1 Tax=Microbacterium endophyticum TaxID=1526412 RepID=A0A7W4V0L3_9MICO|nr:membrane protein insertase YidC [Microbacterium endophyticum]MBB2974672.1 YidC/Oxa1 family membrane protein insertase [Microbacterium endophyticum]NIK36969.1 YidC/Oxa1 family membrane protein insertase [Microbacterium endophyticum]